MRNIIDLPRYCPTFQKNWESVIYNHIIDYLCDKLNYIKKHLNEIHSTTLPSFCAVLLYMYNCHVVNIQQWTHLQPLSPEWWNFMYLMWSFNCNWHDLFGNAIMCDIACVIAIPYSNLTHHIYLVITYFIFPVLFPRWELQPVSHARSQWP